MTPSQRKLEDHLPYRGLRETQPAIPKSVLRPYEVFLTLRTQIAIIMRAVLPFRLAGSSGGAAATLTLVSAFSLRRSGEEAGAVSNATRFSSARSAEVVEVGPEVSSRLPLVGGGGFSSIVDSIGCTEQRRADYDI